MLTISNVADDGAVLVPNDMADVLAAARHWERLLDAGLIGTPPPPPAPGVLENLTATDALFRAIARDRRRLARMG